MDGGGFYYGSRALLPLCSVVGLPIDKLNFLVCQIAAILLGLVYHKLCHPSMSSPALRHFIQITIGLALTSFCFGPQVIHPVIMTTICYAVMRLLPQHMHGVTFVISMGYLGTMHIYRQVYSYGAYTLDITGPIMVLTQKTTALAFQLHDGTMKKPESLNSLLKKQAVMRTPSLLEYFSFAFSFQNLMVGPTIFYSDYDNFIHGKDISLVANPDGTHSYHRIHKGPVLLKKLFIVVISGLVMTVLLPMYPTSTFSEDGFLEWNILQQSFYLLVSITLLRSQYYTAWTLGEMSSVAAGLGVQVSDDGKSEDWSMINNNDIIQVEFATSLKLNMDNWNISTLKWLRVVVYERLPMGNTLGVFICCAFWHGFYPGYYVAFCSASLFVFAARAVRRNVRSYFQTSSALAFIYDCITFAFTRIVNVYMVTPMIVLEFWRGLLIYRSMYFWLHILSILALVVFSFSKKKSSSAVKDKTQ